MEKAACQLWAALFCFRLFSVQLIWGFIPVPTAAKKCDHHALAHYRGESA